MSINASFAHVFYKGPLQFTYKKIKISLIMRSTLKEALRPNKSQIQNILKAFPRGLVSFDLEMTGLNALSDKIIEIAAIKISPQGDITTYHSLVNPMVTISKDSQAFHGLSNKDLKNCSALRAPLKDFSRFYLDLPLVAHNAQFDCSFLIKGHHQYNYPFSESLIFDTCKLSRGLYKKSKQGPKSYKLSDLAQYLKLDFDHHTAMDDASICLHIIDNGINVLKTHLEDQITNSEKLYRALKDKAYLFKMSSFKAPLEYTIPKKLHPLIEIIKNKHFVEIKYLGGSHKGKFRKILPLAFLTMPSGPVLYARCEISNYNKHFKVNKISDIKALL